MPFTICLLLFACQNNQGEDPVVQMPEADQPDQDSGMGWLEGDSGFDTEFNEPMLLTLDVTHSGSWVLSPLAGPYELLTGEMSISEIAAGNQLSPWCSYNFALTGDVVNDSSCETCSFVVDVKFYLLEDSEDTGSPVNQEILQAESIDECFFPDLPTHQEIRRLGFSLPDQTIYFNYYNSGIWIPWYDASQNQNQIDFNWSSQIGFYGFPDDD